MTVFILDTDHLSLLQRLHPVVVRRVSAFHTDTNIIAITIVTAEEQLRGWLAAIRQQHTTDRLI